jgi:hypothetical protein
VWIVGAAAPLPVVCGLNSFKTAIIYSCSVLAGGPTFRVGKKNHIRAVRRGRSRLFADALSPGYLRVRYQCDAKSGDVVEKTGALAHDAHGASNDGIAKRSVQDGIDTVLPRVIALARLIVSAQTPDFAGRTSPQIKNVGIGWFYSVDHRLPPIFISMPEAHGIEVSGETRCPRHLDRTGSRPSRI